MLNGFGGDIGHAPSHSPERQGRAHPIRILPFVMRVVAHDQPLGVTGVFRDHRSLLEDLNEPRQPADFHFLPDMAERHTVLPPLEADEAVDPDLAAHDHIERIR